METNISNRVLIIVPHPDDEINVAGQVIVDFLKRKCEVYVLYTTNGDFNRKIGNSRIYEAIEALCVLGVEEKNIIFLGYGNDWMENDHIYNFSSSVEVKSSASGKRETNSVPNHDEYCYQKYGYHHLFTRDNFKSDLKNVILEYRAKYLICNDFDSHPDHRATSLMFEEVIGEILKEQTNYRPIVLKKFAYSGVWKGKKDYYSTPQIETINTIHGEINGRSFETESPYYKWSERIQLSVPQSTRTELLKDNLLYKAALKHKSQIAWYQILRIASADVVYWWRPTKNLLMNATLRTSSGNNSFLNDFKLYEASDVVTGIDDLEVTKCMWIPDIKDCVPYIEVLFKEKADIRLIRIFSDYSGRNILENIEIEIGERRYYFENTVAADPVWNIEIEENNVSSLKITFLKWKGIVGITELEIYDHRLDFFEESNFELEKYQEISQCNTVHNIQKKLEMFFLNVKLFATYKIKTIRK